MLVAMGEVFYKIVLPILLLAGIGFAVQRKHGLDMQTLLKLNFYLAVPAIIFYSILKSDLTKAGVAIGYTALVMLLLAPVVLAVSWVWGIPRETWRAMLLGTIFWNTGNFSLPLQDLAWRDFGLSVPAMGIQAFVMVGQNLMHFTFGVVLASGGKGNWRQQARTVLAFPPLWAGLAGALVVLCRESMTPEMRQAASIALRPFWDVVEYSRQAFMAIALLSLGAQVANVEPGWRDRRVVSCVLLRNLVGPAIGLAAVWMLGLRGLTAQVLLISSAAPSAVNSVLLSLQFNNHPETVSRTILYSTLLAPLTTTVVVWVAQSGIVR